LTIDGLAIEGNVAQTGGGVYQLDGTLTVKNSTFSNNQASGEGGGIAISTLDAATFLNTTISTNTAGTNGGGLYSVGSPTARVVNSTFTLNTASTGGGMYNATAGMRLDNTIVAQNTAATSRDIHGTFNAASKNNLIGFDSVIGNGIDDGEDGNLVGGQGLNPGRDARLKALGYYGGPTKTHALYYDSDAIDKGDNAVALTYGLDTDQRGSDRIADPFFSGFDKIDIGAVEMAFADRPVF